jgi:hypothetical protein
MSTEFRQILLDEIELLKLGLSDFRLVVIGVILSKGEYCCYVSTTVLRYDSNGKPVRAERGLTGEDFGSNPIEIIPENGDLESQALEIGFVEAKKRGVDLIRLVNTDKFFIVETREPIDLSDFIVQ